MALPQAVFIAVDVLGVVLLHFLWQGALCGIVYAALKPLCARAQARYALGLSALAGMAAAPLLTALWIWPGPATTVADGSATMLASTLRAGGQAFVDWQLKPLLPWLVALWLAGVVALAARSLWQWRKLMRMVRSAATAAPEWQRRLRRLCERFQLRRPVRLLYSTAAVTPMLLGWIKPVILLPASMLSGFSPMQIEMIIAHELGHIRRFDYLVNLMQVTVETVLFYHPVVHWISRDVRNAREACCDDLALQLADGNRLAYARALADLEELRLTPALGAGGGVLLARIKRIVGEAEPVEPLPRSYALPLVLVCAALTSLAWRPHAVPELPAALKAIPEQALALLEKTAIQVQLPRLALDLPPPRVQPVRATAVVSVPAGVPATVGRESDIAPVPPPRVDPVSVALGVTAPSQTAAPARVEPTAAESVATATATPKIAPLHVVSPTYPARAMAAGIEGAVTLEYRIGADGSIGDIRVVSARPAGVFDDAAKSALRGWRYPESNAGAQRVQNFSFTLHGQTRPEEPCVTPTGSWICRRPNL